MTHTQFANDTAKQYMTIPDGNVVAAAQPSGAHCVRVKCCFAASGGRKATSCGHFVAVRDGQVAAAQPSGMVRWLLRSRQGWSGVARQCHLEMKKYAGCRKQAGKNGNGGGIRI